MQTLNGEKQALWKAWRRKNQSEWQTALECRAIGQHWNNIKTLIKARRTAGEQITVAQWSEANAPVTHRWLDEFSGFADRWEEFRAAWKWAQTSPYLPERRPGLHGFVDLINTKAKLEHVRGARSLHQSEKNGPVNAGMQILQGDCLAILRTLPSRSIQTCVTSSSILSASRQPNRNLGRWGHAVQPSHAYQEASCQASCNFVPDWTPA